jgi:hypothetical protein
VHRSCTSKERSCRRKATSGIAIGALRIFRCAEFITNDSDAFTYHHYLLQTGMELNLNMRSGGIGYRSEISLPLSSLDTHGLANKAVISTASAGGGSTRLAVLRLRRGKWTLPTASGSSPALGTRSSQDAASTPNDKDTGIFSSRLRIQEQLRSAHPLDRRRLTLVRALSNAHCVANADLLALNIKSYGTVGTGIALTTKLLWANLANNAMVVHDSELLSANANNHTHLVR